MPLFFSNRCFNPFGLVKHSKPKKVRKISEILARTWSYPTNAYVCDVCRKRLSGEKPPKAKRVIVQRSPTPRENSQTPSESSENSEDPPYIPEGERVRNAQHTATEDQEILKQLKEKFDDPSTSASMKTMILTIAPKSWSENKLAKEFGTSRRQARKAKQLVDQFGILSSPNPRGGRKLPLVTEN